MISHALHLSIFEQPVYIDFFNALLDCLAREKIFQVPGFHLAACHKLLDRGQLKDYAQYGSHDPVIEMRLIIKNQMM